MIDLRCLAERATAAVLYIWLRGVLSTVRIRVVGEPPPGPAVYVSWHRHIVVLSPHHGAHGRWLMTSPAPYLAPVRGLAEWVGCKLAVGTSGDGGAAAVERLCAALDAGDSVALAVDGPAGPAFRAKRGCVTLARRTGAAIVPIAYRTRSGRSLARRWDRMLWVSFFDEVTIHYGGPIFAGERALDEVLVDVERGLFALDPDVAP